MAEGLQPTLTQTEINCLHNAIAASENNEKFGKKGFKTFHLSGSREERSTVALQALKKAGMLDAVKWGNTRQARHTWTVTPEGHDFAKTHRYIS